MSAIESCKNELKDNPFNYPIIHKWNKRVVYKYRFQLFDEIESIIEKNFKPYDFSDFVTVDEVVAGRKIIFE